MHNASNFLKSVLYLKEMQINSIYKNNPNNTIVYFHNRFLNLAMISN